jgi:hypothetical protein
MQEVVAPVSGIKLPKGHSVNVVEAFIQKAPAGQIIGSVWVAEPVGQ